MAALTTGTPSLPAGEVAFLLAQMDGVGLAAGQTVVVYEWEGAVPTETLEPEFILPATLHGTADGIAWGDPVRWTTEETDLVQMVSYAAEDTGVAAWAIQYWGEAVEGAPPELPAEAIDGILAGESALAGTFVLCDFISGYCQRFAVAPSFSVAR